MIIQVILGFHTHISSTTFIKCTSIVALSINSTSLTSSQMLIQVISHTYITLEPQAETSVFAKWQDGTVHEAVVLSARENHKEYYVHFVKYDRRMDQWIGRDRIESVVVLSKE